MMLVDLGRNDLGRVCEYGSVKVERLMFVERYSHVMHLASTSSRTLRRRRRLLRCADGLFPRGDAFGRAEGPRHGNHRRTRAHAAGGLRRRDSLSRFLRQSRFLHRASYVGCKERASVRPGGRGNRGGFGSRARISGIREQGARRDQRARNCASRGRQRKVRFRQRIYLRYSGKIRR